MWLLWVRLTKIILVKNLPLSNKLVSLLQTGCDLISGEGWDAGKAKNEGYDAGKSRDEAGTAKRAKRRRRKLPEIPKDKKRKLNTFVSKFHSTFNRNTPKIVAHSYLCNQFHPTFCIHT